VALVVTNFVQAQTAADIFNKYLNAIGGKEVISKIHSMYMECEDSMMNVPSGMLPKSFDTVNLIIGKGYIKKTDYNGQIDITCITDSGGWTLSPYQYLITGKKGAQPMSKNEYNKNKYNLQIIGTSYIPIDYIKDGYIENKYEGEFVGKEMLDSISVYKLKVTNKDTINKTDYYFNKADYYFDANTYYLIKIVGNFTFGVNRVEATITYSNYQKMDIGYVMPFTQTICTSFNTGSTTTITKIVINPKIDPKIFEKPM
jgi:hypothetical protein